MKYNNIEKLFENSFSFDSKHKVNTTNKVLPLGIVENINKGVTLEQLNELIAKGYDIYKYSTQITIHGICKQLTSNTVSFYQSLILNKNKSLGVKWIAVDAEKKNEICNKLQHFGWSEVHSSTSFHPSLVVVSDNIVDAKAKCNEFKEIANRINKDLFFGSYNIYIGEIWGRYYSVFDLFVNGILQTNVTPLLERITGMNIKEIDAKIKQDDELAKKKHLEFELQYEKERKERLERTKTAMTDARNQMLDNGYNEVDSNTIEVGKKFIALLDRHDDIIIVTYQVTARTCEYISDKEFISGRSGYGLPNAAFYKKEPVKVWVKN